MRRLVTIYLSRSVFFLLPLDATPQFFPVSDDCELANPVLRAATPDYGDLALRGAAAVIGGRAWFNTSFLTLRLEVNDRTAVMNTAYAALELVLQKLRRLSRQADLPRTLLSLRYREEEDGDAPLPPDLIEHEGRATEPDSLQLNAYLYETAITREHLERLATAPSTDAFYEDLLLDSIDAFVTRDWRRTMIYAAFSAEAAANAALAAALRTALVDRPERLRVTVARLPSGEEQVHDPVYNALADQDSFRSLLHERPLYLLGRSLLVEDHGMYQRLRRLYRTRNAIVHSAQAKPDDYPLNEDSSREAIEVVLALLRWLRLAEDFSIPGRFVFLSEIVP